MSDIARQLGVSASTVSRALKNHPGIPESTRERVRQAAEASGYRPDPIMSGLAEKRWARQGDTQGAVLAFLSLGEGPLEHSPQLDGARAAAKNLGYGLAVFEINEEADERRTQRILKARGMRGIVLRYKTATARLPDWEWGDHAVVCCGEPPEDAPATDIVELAITDNHQRLARECLQRGLKRPALILAGQPWMRSEHRRVGGLTTPFLAAGLEPPPFTWWNGRDVEEISTWLRQERADSVLTMTAQQALSLEAAGIVGWGGLPYAAMQIVDNDPERIAGVKSNFFGVGERSVYLCDSYLRQNRYGLPAAPSITQVPSPWHPGLSLG